MTQNKLFCFSCAAWPNYTIVPIEGGKLYGKCPRCGTTADYDIKNIEDTKESLQGWIEYRQRELKTLDEEIKRAEKDKRYIQRDIEKAKEFLAEIKKEI